MKRAQPLVRSCHAAQPEGLRGVSSHAFSVRNLVRLREPGVSRFALHTWLPSLHRFAVLISRLDASSMLMPYCRRME